MSWSTIENASIPIIAAVTIVVAPPRAPATSVTIIMTAAMTTRTTIDNSIPPAADGTLTDVAGP